MGQMCQGMLPGRCPEARHSPVGWLVLIVNVMDLEEIGEVYLWGWLKDFHGGVTEREKPLS